MKLNKTIIAAIGALSLSGCASIVGETDQGVTINSTPSKADVVITDESSKQVFAGTTPTTVQLSKADGTYFGGKTYTVEISKDGYDNRTLMIDSSPNGWYIGGNLVFGGLIGWLIVDPLTGAMYNLSPDNIDASLGEKVATSDNGDKEINLVLLQDVPAHMRDKMEPIGQI
ncbi:hypothetical protein [Halomonas salinarum]|uniref:hypothetical protein n=1 Tax=Halomonas salinarum TaxID=1158993 RepID=UPI00143C6DA0|nr:hypothetical protein [Halomonas salinarum]